MELHKECLMVQTEEKTCVTVEEPNVPLQTFNHFIHVAGKTMILVWAILFWDMNSKAHEKNKQKRVASNFKIFPYSRIIY